MTYEDRILDMMSDGLEYTTQLLTELCFSCKKGDARYHNYVEDVGKDLQRLKKKGIVEGQKFNTGHGYSIYRWRLKR